MLDTIAILDRVSFPQSNIILILIIDLGKKEPFHIESMQTFQFSFIYLINHVLHSPYPPNLILAPLRTLPTDFGITVPWATMSKSPRKFFSLPPGHFIHTVYRALGSKLGVGSRDSESFVNPHPD